jgi:hypothetical protein
MTLHPISVNFLIYEENCIFVFISEGDRKYGFFFPKVPFRRIPYQFCAPPPVHKYLCLKVLTNEKRGGLRVGSFDRYPVKLFSLKFSNKLVQAPS